MAKAIKPPNIRIALTGRAGYTLIEVLIAGLIIAAVVAGIYTFISQGSILNKNMQNQRRAYQEMERILENPLYSYPSYLDTWMDAGRYTIDSTVMDDRGNTDPSDDLKCKREYSILNLTVNLLNETIPAKRVRAFVTWTDEGIVHAESLETIITLVNIN